MDKLEYWPFIWRYLQIAVGEPWLWASSISLVIAILAGLFMLVKKPKWSERMNKLVLVIPALLFVVGFIISIVFIAPYKIYEEQWDKISVSINEISKDVRELEKMVDMLERMHLNIMPKDADLSGITIKDSAIDLSALETDSITSKVFQRCYFTGEADIYITTSNSIGCSIRDNANPFIVANVAPENTTVFSNCTFEDCVFWGITIYGNESDISKIKEGIEIDE